MKTLLYAFLCGSLARMLFASDIQDAYVFDPKEKLIAEEFNKTRRAEIIESEKQKIATLIDAKRAQQYMGSFTSGMDSTSGIILLEGEDSEWLRVAYWSGYQAKMSFMMGYVMGENASSAKQEK